MNVLDQYRAGPPTGRGPGAATIRNYLSDLRQFATGVKFTGSNGKRQTTFRPERVATPNYYRLSAYLQQDAPSQTSLGESGHHHAETLLAWLAECGQIKRNPAKVVNGQAELRRRGI